MAETEQRQSLRFLALYALAAAGGAVAYVPFLTILLPVRVADVTSDGVTVLAYAAFCGAVAASLANIGFGWLSDRMLHVIGLAITDDFCGNFANLSNTDGSSGVDLTIAQLIAAKQGVRTRTGGNYDAVVSVLDTAQVSDVEAALLATNAAAAIYALSADRLIGYSPVYDNSPNRQVMTFNGSPVFSTGLTDTANAGADVVGATFCPSTAYNDASGATTYAFAWKRMPRLETERIAIGRSTALVMTARAASAEMQDGSGTGIVTDA